MKIHFWGKHGFKTTGWAVCDAIPAGSYVDCSFFEVIPELMRVAELSEELILKRVAVTVVRGMQHGLSMPQDMYGYAMPGVQCEGYMNSLWLADTEYKEFSGAAAKIKEMIMILAMICQWYGIACIGLYELLSINELEKEIC